MSGNSPDVSPRFGTVVFLDMLGTRGIWKNRDPKDVLQNYKSILDSFADGIDFLNKKTGAWEEFREFVKFEMTAFSDTIIITGSLPDAKREIPLMVGLVTYATSLLMPLIIPSAIANNIYMRGAISLGQFYRLDKMLIGPAVDEAAQYYMLPEWIGVSAAPSFHDFLDELGDDGVTAKEFFVKWDIPMKNGIEKGGWAINWPNRKIFRPDGESRYNDFDRFYDETKRVIKSELKTYDVVSALKWRNTSDFFKTNFK